MQLLRTHDGQVGWKHDDKVRWFDTLSKAKCYALLHWEFNRLEYHVFARDLDWAVEHMARSGDTIAQFDITGNLMYTTKELDYGT